MDFEDRGRGSGVVIGSARVWPPAWVIVSQYKGVGVGGDGRAQDLAGMNEGVSKNSETNEVPADDREAEIEQDASDTFLIWGEPCSGCDVLVPESVDDFRGGERSWEIWSFVDAEHPDLGGSEIETAAGKRWQVHADSGKAYKYIIT